MPRGARPRPASRPAQGRPAAADRVGRRGHDDKLDDGAATQQSSEGLEEGRAARERQGPFIADDAAPYPEIAHILFDGVLQPLWTLRLALSPPCFGPLLQPADACVVNSKPIESTRPGAGSK